MKRLLFETNQTNRGLFVRPFWQKKQIYTKKRLTEKFRDIKCLQTCKRMVWQRKGERRKNLLCTFFFHACCISDFGDKIYLSKVCVPNWARNRIYVDFFERNIGSVGRFFGSIRGSSNFWSILIGFVGNTEQKH